MGSISVTESISRLLVSRISVSDAVACAESVSYRNVLFASKTDDIAITESLTKSITLPLNVSDATVTGEYNYTTELIFPNVYETVVVEEPGLYILHPFSTESISVEESETVNAGSPSIIEINQHENIYPSDYVDRLFQQLVINKSESILLQELVDKLFYLTISVYDEITQEKGVRVYQSEDITLGESSTSKIQNFKISVNDASQILDAIEAIVQYLSLSVSDIVTDGEYTDSSMSSFSIETSDSIMVGETSEGLEDFYQLNVNDKTTIEEYFFNFISSGLQKSISDEIVITDSVEAIFKNLTSEQSDVISISDGIDVLFSNIPIDVSESISVGETQDYAGNSYVDKYDSVSIDDVGQIAPTGSYYAIYISDSVGIVDSASTWQSAFPGYTAYFTGRYPTTEYEGKTPVIELEGRCPIANFTS